MFGWVGVGVSYVWGTLLVIGIWLGTYIGSVIGLGIWYILLGSVFVIECILICLLGDDLGTFGIGLHSGIIG
nr:MAG TPA: hypothetical protein [Caudoviricetes sp.]